MYLWILKDTGPAAPIRRSSQSIAEGLNKVFYPAKPIKMNVKEVEKLLKDVKTGRYERGRCPICA